MIDEWILQGIIVADILVIGGVLFVVVRELVRLFGDSRRG